ncbi:MAG: GGDEF domain-containing protein [Actinomycetota bacterium]
MSVGILEHAPIPSLLLRADGTITWCNTAAAKLLELTTESLAGTPLQRFAPADERAALDQALRCPSEPGTSRQFHATLESRDGTTITVELHVVGLDDEHRLAQAVAIAAESGGATLPQQRRFRTAMLELSELSHEHVDEREFYDVFIRRAVDAVPGAQAGSILIRAPGTERFDFVGAVGYDLEGLQQRSLDVNTLKRDFGTPIAEVRRGLTTEDMSDEDLRWMTEVGRIHEIRCNVAAPVLSDGDAVALVCLDNFEDPDAFDQTAVEMTTVLGRLVADLIRRRRLEAELRHERESYKHLAHHDGLTGLANRRHVEAKIADAVAESTRTRRPLAVSFIDLDDFKQINDTHGHDVGDRVLVAVADTLKVAAGPDDVVGRWGGDEFVIVSPGARSRVEANRLAERVLAGFQGALHLDSGAVVRCGLSIGIAWSRDGAEGFHTLLRRADEALYHAKVEGKNRVRVDAP